MDDESIPRELRQVHERIATLEGQLRELDRPDVSPPSWTYFLAGLFGVPIGLVALFVLLTFLVGIAGSVSDVIQSRFEPPPPVAPPPPTPTPPSTRVGARWYSQSDVAPLTLDVNGDADPDFVGLAWDDSGRDQVFVVAFDGKTLEPLWHAGPYPATWHSEVTHLARVNGRIVATDRVGHIHVIDPKTATEEKTLVFPAGASYVCTAAESDVLLVRDQGGEAGAVTAFDVKAGLAVEAPKDRKCSYAEHAEREERDRGGIMSTRDYASHTKTPGVWTSETFAAGAVTVAVGSRTVDDRTQGYAVAWETTTKKTIWEHALLEGDDKEHGSRRLTLVDADSVYVVYQAEDTPRLGPFRVAAFSVATGEKQWAATLPGSAEGSWLGALGEGGGHVYVVTNFGLHVIDRKTGVVLANVEHF